MIFHKCDVVKKCLGRHFDKLRIKVEVMVKVKVKVKVKVGLPCLITNPTLHKNVWEEWRYSSTVLDLSTRWK
jgi:hypothetical protein